MTEIINTKDIKEEINISVLGKSGIGKTATIVKLLTKRFIGEYSSLIDDKYFFTLTNEMKEYLITIQDTTDQSSLDLDSIIKWSHIIIVMFSIIDRSSFNKALILIQFIAAECLKKNEKYDIHICLVANKMDLSRLRVISSDEGMQLTKDFPIAYYESSVVNEHVVVETLFLDIIQKYLNSENRASPKTFLRVNSSSSFTNVRMIGPSGLSPTSQTIRSSVASLNDTEPRRNSIENGRKHKSNETENYNNSSKSSLNSLINSSTKRIKAEGFKFFKRPK